MLDVLLHSFFMDGGQVCISARSGSTVTFPDCWWDTYSTEELSLLEKDVLIAIKNIKEINFLSVIEVAEKLYLPYKHVLNLIRLQHLGSLKVGGIIKIYSPSISVYLKRFVNFLPCSF